MKLISKQFFITFIFGFVLLGNQIRANHLKNNDVPPKHIVIDHTTDPTLNHVVRRDPSLTVEHKYTTTPEIKRDFETESMDFTNTNDNNGPLLPNHDYLDTNYGKPAEIATPAIYVHSKGKMSVIQETPAHVGWRSEKKVITSLNKATSNIKL